MSYIIKNNELIAYTDKKLKGGTEVRYAYDSCNDRTQLVNARFAKISNNKMWSKRRMSGSSMLIGGEDALYPDFLIFAYDDEQVL